APGGGQVGRPPHAEACRQRGRGGGDESGPAGYAVRFGSRRATRPAPTIAASATTSVATSIRGDGTRGAKSGRRTLMRKCAAIAPMAAGACAARYGAEATAKKGV